VTFDDAIRRGEARAQQAMADSQAAKDVDVVTPLDAYPVEQAALDAYDAGLCPIRSAIDGTKKPLGAWKHWQAQPPTRDQIAAWFGDGHPGMGIVTGQVSGNLELLEFEGRATTDGTVTRFKDLIHDAGLDPEWERIVLGYSERTPSDGFHVLWRCDTIGGNTKLARRPNPRTGEIEVLIETRGEGGFVICAPSGGPTHPTGKPWVRLHGSFATIATIHPQLRQHIFDLAALLDELPDSEPVRVKPAGDPGDGGTLPGFDLTVDDVLERAGFTVHHSDRQGNTHWTRPGKDTRHGSSLTVWNDDGRATPWSTSIGMPGEFITGKRLLTAWQLHVGLNHRGDFAEAGKRWRDLNSLNSLISPSRTSPLSSIQLSNTTISDNDTTERNNGVGGEEGSKGEKSELSEERSWPQLHPAALHGPIGQATQLLAPHTEADPTAVLATLLTGWASSIGRSPHVVAGHAQHAARLSIVIVGDTAKARKGTSWATARQILDNVDPHFMLTRVIGGFGSGESVIDEVRDPQPSDDPEKPGDPGAADKRLLIHEPEFARVLKVCARESSILSTIIRDAWDGSRLQARARTRQAVATDHHISIIGHITAPELGRTLDTTEIAGGFANRILWICARRSQRLPFDVEIDPHELADVTNELRARAEQARRIGPVTFAADARARWELLYNEMADDDPGGLLGMIVARPEPQTLRLALIYALLDGAHTIGQDHIDAAWALWTYSRQSATYIWGDAIGDEIADTLLRAIRKAGPGGIDLTSQSALFSRKIPAKRLATARTELEACGLIETLQVQTDGRPRQISRTP
jgi:hypothetical protein